MGCFVLVQDSDGGTEWERLKRNLFASLGVLALTLCGSLGDDGTNCSSFHNDCRATYLAPPLEPCVLYWESSGEID